MLGCKRHLSLAMQDRLRVCIAQPQNLELLFAPYAKLCHALAASRIVLVAGEVAARSSLSIPSDTTFDVRALCEKDCEGERVSAG